MKVLIATLLIAAAAALSYWYLKPAVIAKAPTPHARLHRLTPEGEFCLLQYASLKTAYGVHGFPPGTRVKLVQDKGDTMMVSKGADQFEVASDILTNDLDLADLAARNDAASQQEYGRQMQAAKDRQSKDMLAMEQQREKDLAAHRQDTTLLSGSSALNRGAYNNSGSSRHVTRRPIIYRPVRGSYMDGW